MDYLDKKKLAIFPHLEAVVSDVLERVQAVIKRGDSGCFDAYILELDNDWFWIRNFKHVKVEACFSSTCDTEHGISFRVGDKPFQTIKHYQDYHDCGDAMPFLITDLDALAEALVKQVGSMVAPADCQDGGAT